ncbi:MAG TPA: hypothetical protein VJ945_06210 [Flavobacteriaceae bacterium]|nr:hypothetical protein [Flavobacteriaceae bacterium]
MTTFKSTYQRVSELENVKDVFNFIKGGFDADYETMKGFTSFSEMPETILKFVKDCSKGFQSDVATKTLKYGNMSEKQAWCVAFEFIKIKNLFSTYLNELSVKFQHVA